MSHSPSALPRPLPRLAAIVALFALLGPLAGALGVNILLSGLAAATEIARGNMGDVLRLLVGGVVVGTIVSLPLAYSFGLVSAVGVGLAVAIADRRGIGISCRHTLVWAGVFWLVTAGLVVIVVPAEGLLVWLVAFLVAHLLASCLCTLLARRLFAPAPDGPRHH